MAAQLRSRLERSSTYPSTPRGTHSLAALLETILTSLRLVLLIGSALLEAS